MKAAITQNENLSIQRDFNVFNIEECQRILDLRKKSSVNHQGELGDLVIFKESANEDWQEIIKLIKKKLERNLDRYYSKFFNLLPFEKIDISHIGFLCDEKGSFTELHYDWELVLLKNKTIIKPFVCLIYLTDVEEGGELLFPLQKNEFKPEIGMTILFPCHFSYPHLSMPVTKGAKHVCRVTYKIDINCYKVDELEI